jgi:serine/threonine-protein kinase
MADCLKVIAPRAPTPMPTASTDPRTSGRLPAEMLADQLRRLATFSVVAAACWTFGLLMDLFVVPIMLRQAVPAVAIGLEVAGILTAAALFGYVRFAPHAAETKIAVGLASMVANAAAIAVLNAAFWRDALPHAPVVSWTGVVILIYAMICPAAPRRMLPAVLLAATMDPLVMWVMYARGLPTLPPLTAFLHYLPNYICAGLAMVPYRIVHRLGRRLREAQELGSYQLVELLGRGGMGEVWRAEHRLLARDAAVKLVRPEVLGAGTAGDAEVIRRRFEREAQATAALSSPHTIKVFDYGVTNDGTFYYVMELLAGRDLESLVREFGPVPADRAMFLLRQACHSLADAHARGLVHRDVKPANIYVCRLGLEYDFVKVLDFGLVKLRHSGAGSATELRTVDQTLARIDHTTGTPAYMAPEIILGETDVDRRADVYALGCVAYYLLTGQLVFEADTPMKMLLQHVQAEPIRPSQRTELPIPRELDDLVLACLQKNPDRRPQNAEELFNLAQRCRTCETWGQPQARLWWETHLAELCGPLTIASVPGVRSVAAV